MSPSPRQSSNARRRLAATTVAMLPRIADSLSFLYLDIVRIHQDDTGVCAEVTSERRGTETVILSARAEVTRHPHPLHRHRLRPLRASGGNPLLPKPCNPPIKSSPRGRR